MPYVLLAVGLTTVNVGGQRRPEDSFWILLHVFSERDCGILGQIHPCSLAKACLSFSSSPPVAQGSRNFELVKSYF